MTRSAKRTAVPVEKRLPPTNARVIVICQGCRCLGYLDEQGVWRDAAKSEQIENVIGWMSFLNGMRSLSHQADPSLGARSGRKGTA